MTTYVISIQRLSRYLVDYKADIYKRSIYLRRNNKYFFISFQMSSVAGLREARQMVRPALRRRRRRCRQEVRCTSDLIVIAIRIHFTPHPPPIVKVKEVTI